MTLALQAKNRKHADLLISELVKSGVHHFCISPGSNNTPLIMAAHDHPMAKTYLHYDERSLGFFALGLSKVGKPACIISTSGTAVCNFYPAIVEASMSHVPLVLVTADRSHDLRDTLSNQTIDQIRMFGNYMRWEGEIALSSDVICEHMIETTINQACYRSQVSPAGPVWINVPIKEPREAPRYTEKHALDYSLSPYTKYFPTDRVISDETTSHIAKVLSSYEEGMIVAGAITDPLETDAILSLAKKLSWPVLADSMSPLRSAGEDLTLIQYYNLILECTPVKEEMKPKVILHFGGPFVSKALLTWIGSLNLDHYFHVANFPRRCDPIHKISERIEMKPDLFAAKVENVLPEKPVSSWLTLWKEYSLSIGDRLREYFQENEVLSEPSIFHFLSENFLQESLLFTGSSLPIRHIDKFFFPSNWMCGILSNRGASGIDGLVSTAAGCAEGSGKHVVAILGDMTFLHDVGALSLLKKYEISITLVVLNNRGGGIFQFLPVAEKKEYFEKYYVNSPDEPIQKIGAAYKIASRKIDSYHELETSLEEGSSQKRPFIIEIETNREETYDIYQDLQKHLESSCANIKKSAGAL